MTPDLARIIESLRNELQQYGEMLALLDHQQELVRMRGADDILHSIASINAQSATIQAARERREGAQQYLARSLGQPLDSTFATLLPLVPDHYRPLVGALVQENNELLQRVRHRAAENQSILRRSLELMQRFITTLSPESGGDPVSTPPGGDPVSTPPGGDPVSTLLAIEPGSPLYGAIV